MGGYCNPNSKILIPSPCARRPQLVARREEAVDMGGYCNPNS